MKKRVLHLDSNHEILAQGLAELGFENVHDYTTPRETLLADLHQYEGIIIRSRFRIDAEVLNAAKNLKFIGRVGAGLENIDCDYAQSKGIALIACPEGNANAVGEHSISLLLNLMNRIRIADNEVRNGIWIREGNRGYELEGRTVGIIGYGHMGKSFARKLRGFEVQTLCYDILPNVGDALATQVDWETLLKESDVISIHTPYTPQTHGMLNQAFFDGLAKPIFLLNTSRGKNLVTADLVQAIEKGQVIGAGLDVMEFEKSSFENFFDSAQMPAALEYLIHSDRVILTPHIAGWTHESKFKMAQIIVDKVAALYGR